MWDCFSATVKQRNSTKSNHRLRLRLRRSHSGVIEADRIALRYSAVANHNTVGGSNWSRSCRSLGGFPGFLPSAGLQLRVSGPTEGFSARETDATRQARDGAFTFHTLTQWCLKTMCAPPLPTGLTHCTCADRTGGLLFFPPCAPSSFIQECPRTRPGFVL